MVSRIFMVAAFAAGLVSAGNLHAHQKHAALHRARSNDASNFPAPDKANASCGCTTYTTTWYGAPTLVPIAPPERNTTTTAHAASQTSNPGAPKQKPEEKSNSSSCSSTVPAAAATPAVKPAPAKPAPAKPAAPAVKAPAPPSYKAPPAPSSNNGKWAMTYTPYTASGSCKDASTVHADIASIKSMGFNTVRLYATDCSGIQNVGSACTSTGLKMIMGIYIDAAGLGPAYNQVTELTSWGKTNGWNMVEMVVAGNEAVFNGFTTAPALAGFLSSCKSAFKAAGYNGPVTTTEPVNIIQANAGVLCPVVDVIAANIHPFFNGAVAASDAGSFVKSQMGLLSQACGGKKEAYCLETGWPSGGNANGVAIPGASQQKQAVDSIVAATGSKSAIFSFTNDGWKHPGELGVEQFFGCSSIFADLL